MKRCLIAYAHNLFYCLSICSDGVVMKKKGDALHITFLPSNGTLLILLLSHYPVR